MTTLCRTLEVPRSGYYAWRGRPEPSREGNNRRPFDQHRGRYGAPRLTVELPAEGWRVRRRVAKRLRVLGLRAKAAREYKATTPSKHRLPVAPNRLEQNFTAPAPNRA